MCYRWGFQNLELGKQSLCDACVIASGSNVNPNRSGNGAAPTPTACATPRGGRAAQIGNRWGFPNVELENQSLCDTCVAANESTVNPKPQRQRRRIHTYMCICASKCFKQPRGAYLAHLKDYKLGTCE